jgi:hypothetical protein
MSLAVAGGMLGLGRWRTDVEQLAGEREVVGLHAARQQTVVADAMSASWGRAAAAKSCGQGQSVALPRSGAPAC